MTWILAGLLFIVAVFAICFACAAMDRKAVDRGWA